MRSGPSEAQLPVCIPPPVVVPWTIMVPDCTVMGMALAHVVPVMFSSTHALEQPSPLVVLPSSHCSEGSFLLLPQVALQPEPSSWQFVHLRPAGFVNSRSMQV